MRFNAVITKRRILRLLGQMDKATDSKRLDIHDQLHLELSRLKPSHVQAMVDAINDEYDSYSFLHAKKQTLVRASMVPGGSEPRGIQFGGRYSLYIPLSSSIEDSERPAISACRKMLTRMFCLAEI